MIHQKILYAYRQVSFRAITTQDFKRHKRKVEARQLWRCAKPTSLLIFFKKFLVSFQSKPGVWKERLLRAGIPLRAEKWSLHHKGGLWSLRATWPLLYRYLILSYHKACHKACGTISENTTEFHYRKQDPNHTTPATTTACNLTLSQQK